MSTSKSAALIASSTSAVECYVAVVDAGAYHLALLTATPKCCVSLFLSFFFFRSRNKDLFLSDVKKLIFFSDLLVLVATFRQIKQKKNHQLVGENHVSIHISINLQGSSCLEQQRSWWMGIPRVTDEAKSRETFGDEQMPYVMQEKLGQATELVGILVAELSCVTFQFHQWEISFFLTKWDSRRRGDQTGVKMGAGYAKLRIYWNFYFKMVIHQLGGTSS